MLKGKPIKISVIGVGHVGSVVGFILARGGLANEKRSLRLKRRPKMWE
jgi:tRNA A37 threonylcarbamoyladenosine dehydratase